MIRKNYAALSLWWALGLFFLATAATAWPAETAMLFSNDFESVTAPFVNHRWAGGAAVSIGLDGTQAFTGKKSLKISKKAAAWGGAFVPVAFKNKGAYQFSCRVKLPEGAEDEALLLTLMYTSGKGKQIAKPFSPGTIKASDGWKAVKCVFKIDETAEIAEGPDGGIIFPTGTTPDCTLYVDDFELRIIPELDDLSELPIINNPIVSPLSDQEFRILVVGNSISRHGFNSDTMKNLGWDHLSGMAATAESNDYVHVLANALQKAMPTRKIQLTFTSLVPGGNGTTEDRLATVMGFVSGNYNLIIIQHGEHEKAERGIAAAEQTYDALVSLFDGVKKPMVICIGVWAPWASSPSHTVYQGFFKDLNEMMKRVAENHHFGFVSVEDTALDPANSGWGHVRVKGHPNDRGHKMYAIKTLIAFKQMAKERSMRLEEATISAPLTVEKTSAIPPHAAP